MQVGFQSVLQAACQLVPLPQAKAKHGQGDPPLSPPAQLAPLPYTQSAALVCFRTVAGQVAASLQARLGKSAATERTPLDQPQLRSPTDKAAPLYVAQTQIRQTITPRLSLCGGTPPSREAQPAAAAGGPSH